MVLWYDQKQGLLKPLVKSMNLEKRVEMRHATKLSLTVRAGLTYAAVVDDAMMTSWLDGADKDCLKNQRSRGFDWMVGHWPVNLASGKDYHEHVD